MKYPRTTYGTSSFVANAPNPSRRHSGITEGGEGDCIEEQNLLLSTGLSLDCPLSLLLQN
jgi:hypothetical protein